MIRLQSPYERLNYERLNESFDVNLILPDLTHNYENNININNDDSFTITNSDYERLSKRFKVDNFNPIVNIENNNEDSFIINKCGLEKLREPIDVDLNLHEFNGGSIFDEKINIDSSFIISSSDLDRLSESFNCSTDIALPNSENNINNESFVITNSDLAKLSEPININLNENIINQSVYSLSSIESHKNYDSNLVHINTNSDNQLICSSSIQSKVSNNFYNASELKINSNSKINISDVNSVEDQELDNYIKNWPLVSNPDILSKYFNNLYKSVTSDNEMFGGSLFKITKNTKKHLKKFNCWEHTIELATTDTKLDNFLTAGDIYFDLFTQVFQQFIEPLNSKSKIRVLIFHDDFQVPINLSFMDKKDLTVQLLFDAIDKTVQSKKKILILKFKLIKN